MARAEAKAKDQTKIRLEEEPYPSGAFGGTGQHLQALTENKSSHTTPAQTIGRRPRLNCIAIPTSRNVRHSRKLITRIMRLAQQHGAGFLLFLCSGQARKEDIASVARAFPGLSWAAIDGPFIDEGICNFQTTQSLIASGGTRDLSQKRNLALLLARLMGWEKLFLLDDDIELDAADLARAVDLLGGKASAVGFSVREFPDHSVTVHASQWAQGPIDSFIGGGALAINTNNPHLSFFPHVYNEDWLFLLLHCLVKDDALIWAGTLKQGKYNPFGSIERAQNEEPGDLLAESLMRLVMALKADKLLPEDFEDVLTQIKLCADKDFWEHEINERILFIRRTEDKVRLRKMPGRKKRHVLHSLERSLATLTGSNGVRGLRGAELAAWVRSWVQDIQAWDQLVAQLPGCNTFGEAIEYLGLANQYLYNRGQSLSDPRQHMADSEKPLVPPDLEGLPNIPRSPEILQGLRSTKALETYSVAQNLDMSTVVESANRLRFDRPADEDAARAAKRPLFTICMLVSNGESTGLTSMSVQRIKEWAHAAEALQLIIWVHSTNDYRQDRAEHYRDTLISRLVPEIAGSNIYLRSEVLPTGISNIDHLIDSALEGSAFAYWDLEIEGDHQVYIVNSKNELLRKGTFWDFLRQRHIVPGQPLSTYLRKASAASPQTAHLPLSAADDEQAINQARLNLLHHRTRSWLPRVRLRKSATAKVMRSMQRAKLSWLELDDMAYNVRVHETRGKATYRHVTEVRLMPIVFGHNLASEAYLAAKTVLNTLSKLPKTNQAIECMVVIYGGSDASWSQLTQFKAELVRLTLEQCTWNDIVISSFVCHPAQASTASRAKLIATAACRYLHWLHDHTRLPGTHWYMP